MSRRKKKSKPVCELVDDYEAKCCCGVQFAVYDDFVQHGCEGKSAGFDPYGKDYENGCDNCGQTPTVAATGLCGPCTWGEAETINGNW